MSTTNGNASAATPVSPPSTTQYINLANYMYYAYDTPYTQTQLASEIGFSPLLQKNGKPVVSVDDAAGLYAEAFISTSGNQVIIAYEGTQLGGAKGPSLFTQGPVFTPAEIFDDAQLFADKKANSLTGSANFAKHVILLAGEDNISPQNIYVTGHSLGAAEADYAASQTGLAGVTFAAPGIDTKYTGTYPSTPNAGNVVNYVDAGDPIGNYAADGADTLAPVLTSNNIKHYGSVDVLPNAVGQENLQLYAQSYSAQNSAADKAVVLAAAIAANGTDHLLPEYAKDLGTAQGLNGPLPLYPIDGSTDGSANSQLGFYPSTSKSLPKGSVDTSYIAAAMTGGGMPQSSSASSSTGNASVLAASSDTSAHAMGVKPHAG